jgi:hypothetical protein
MTSAASRNQLYALFSQVRCSGTSEVGGIHLCALSNKRDIVESSRCCGPVVLQAVLFHSGQSLGNAESWGRGGDPSRLSDTSGSYSHVSSVIYHIF